jgi:hypothetical protein
MDIPKEKTPMKLVGKKTKISEKLTPTKKLF